MPLASIRNDDPVMTTSELSEYLRRPEGTLRQWRHRGHPAGQIAGAAFAVDDEDGCRRGREELERRGVGDHAVVDEGVRDRLRAPIWAAAPSGR
ncbi:MAG TPA: hypothetical protein VFI46_13920 [Jiangellaceae bacterium]|nr:hypothetical protein [Jiangellaceae bacterium]